jgi:hypothetical protein
MMESQCRLRKLAEVCTLAVVLSLSAGCAPGKRPFLMVQMCLSNEGGVDEFISELKSLSSEEKLQFVDNSRNAERELKGVGHAGLERTDASRLIDVRVMRSDGMGIGATNLGLPGYQMAMGFSAGSNATDAQELASRTLLRIKKRWSVESVPAGAGAKPMADCR